MMYVMTYFGSCKSVRGQWAGQMLCSRIRREEHACRWQTNRKKRTLYDEYVQQITSVHGIHQLKWMDFKQVTYCDISDIL